MKRTPAHLERRTLLACAGAAAASAGSLVSPSVGAPLVLATDEDPSAARTDRLIDVHAQFIPDAYRRALLAVGYDRAEGMFGIPEWSEASMLGTMQRRGLRGPMRG